MVRNRLRSKIKRREYWQNKVNICVEKNTRWREYDFWMRWKPSCRRTRQVFGTMSVSTAHVIRHVWISENYRGLGLGECIYKYALAYLGSLKTHYNKHSDDAHRVWDKLLPYYRHTFNRGILTIYKT